MSSAPVAGAAFERYHQQRGGGGAAAAANGNTVRACARAVPCVGTRALVAGVLVLFSYPMLMGISLPHFSRIAGCHRCPVPCLLGLLVKVAWLELQGCASLLWFWPAQVAASVTINRVDWTLVGLRC